MKSKFSLRVIENGYLTEQRSRREAGHQAGNEAEDADDDEVQRDDVVEQLRHEENQDAGDQRDDWRHCDAHDHGNLLRSAIKELAAHGIAAAGHVAFRKQHLEEVQAALRQAECLGAAVEIDPPDAAEALVEALRIERADPLPVAVEALRPGVERERIVAAQVLDVQHFEAGALHLDDGIGKARDPAAWKHVAADEELGLEACDVADEMQHAKAAGLEEPGVRLHHLGELVASGMLEGADRDHLVVLVPSVAKIGVDDLQIATELAPRNPGADHLDLRRGGVHAGHAHAGFLVGVEHEAAEAGADVHHRLAGLEQELARDVLDLVPLRFLERARALFPVGAGVHHQRVVEPHPVELGAERVVAFGVLLRPRPAAVGAHELVPAVAHVREPVHPVAARLHAVRERRRRAALDGELDIEGNLAKAMAAGMEGGMDRPKPLVRVRNWWHELRFSNASWRQARTNADFHYALGPEFYRLWLDDPLLMYTCAYWQEGTRTPGSSSPAASACCISSATSDASRPSSSSAATCFPAAGSRALPIPSSRWSAPASKCWTSRTCAAITRSRSTPGASASTATGSAFARSIRSASTSASAGSGASTCTAAPRHSACRRAACTSSRCCFQKAT